MVDMGAEVGQKMRSAIKAKLTELNCYVDDELPDYIMVMVANKRTKTQMNEDLTLFLKGRTSTFVDWLHLVLKKLKEVTVTNLDVYKKASKRKSNELTDAKLSDKKIKKELSRNSKEPPVKQELKSQLNKSLTDDLPLNVNVKSLSENRKIVLIADSSKNNHDQNFNSPSCQEIEQPNLKELEEIETQIRNVKSRLGLKIDQEVEESDLQRIVEESKNKPVGDDILSNGRQIVIETPNSGQKPVVEERNDKECEESRSDEQVKTRKEHSKIVFSKEDFMPSVTSPPRKKSILDRLGRYEDKKSKFVLSRLGSYTHNNNRSGNSGLRDADLKRDSGKRDSRISRIREKNLSRKEKREEDNGKNGKFSSDQSSRTVSAIIGRKDLKKRLGLSSKVTIPQIDPQLLEDTFKKREVVSVVKVKPRILPPNAQQANKNLLLKAVADAQKSIAQSKSVGNNPKNNSPSRSESLRTQKNKEQKIPVHKPKVRKVSQEGKDRLQQFLSSYVEESSDQEDLTPAKKTDVNIEYIPTKIDNQTEEYDPTLETKQKFIVTLDGIQRSDILARLSKKDVLSDRKNPSPIIFEQSEAKPKTERNIPEELPLVSVSLPKKKEKCKYFPSCKNGPQCEFYHPVKPVQMCEQFPYCKFGDNCHYIHPKCKFGTSCTKRDCSYSHSDGYGTRAPIPVVPIKTQVSKLQICKFFPKCMNVNCSFHHPKPCKYGIYCKNQSVCNYIHTNFPNKNSLTWRSK